MDFYITYARVHVSVRNIKWNWSARVSPTSAKGFVNTGICICIIHYTRVSTLFIQNMSRKLKVAVNIFTGISKVRSTMTFILCPEHVRKKVSPECIPRNNYVFSNSVQMRPSSFRINQGAPQKD